EGGDEADACAAGRGGGGAKVGQLVVGVELAPAGAVVGIVLRTVDEGVHAARGEEPDHGAAGIAGPGSAVVALDHAAKWGWSCHRAAGGGREAARRHP